MNELPLLYKNIQHLRINEAIISLQSYTIRFHFPSALRQENRPSLIIHP